MPKTVKQPRKRRAMTTERARHVRLAGHEAEGEFVSLIGGQIYPGTKKKDVVDMQGNIHSVKSGDAKWQIFLYSKSRFETSVGFLGAPLFIDCINSFPEKRNDYLKNKTKFKTHLQQPMKNLKEFLSRKEEKLFLHRNKIIFLLEAIFHSSEVDYLTIKDGSAFHIFDADQVIKTIDSSVILTNSKASQKGQMNNQKVLFKLSDSGVTIGEIEMRNDSHVHYRQVKFWMDRILTLALLKDKIKPARKKSERVIAYGKAADKFKLSQTSRRAIN